MRRTPTDDSQDVEPTGVGRVHVPDLTTDPRTDPPVDSAFPGTGRVDPDGDVHDDATFRPGQDRSAFDPDADRSTFEPTDQHGPVRVDEDRTADHETLSVDGDTVTDEDRLRQDDLATEDRHPDGELSDADAYGDGHDDGAREVGVTDLVDPVDGQTRDLDVAAAAGGAAALDSDASTTLWPEGTADGLRERWHDVQLRFVDDPKAAADEAKALVGEAVESLRTALADQQSRLDSWSTGEHDDTENLRVAVQHYRDFLDQVLAR